MEEKKRIGVFLEKDFRFIENTFISDTEKLIKEAQSDKYADLLEASKRAFYLQHFIDDMKFFGYGDLSDALSESLNKKFGSRDVLKTIQEINFTKAIKQLSGQQVIGENSYIVYDSVVYYRSFIGKWYEISTRDVFYLLPELKKEVGGEMASRLEQAFEPTIIYTLYDTWKEKSTSNSEECQINMHIEEGITTPEKYFTQSVEQIKYILKNPPSLNILENIHGQDENYLERLCKVSYRIIQFIKNLRSKDNYPIYLLRDGIMFAEAHKAMDLLNKEDTFSGQLMISRKILSSPDKDQYFFLLIVDVLYSALSKYPDNFEKFYEEYRIQMSAKEVEYPELGKMLDNLEKYISPHVAIAAREKKDMTIVDTGLQGSINMLTKYIIDERISEPSVKSDVRMFVAGEWFKGIYKNKYESEYYPIMKDIEIFNRSEHLYVYKKDSFEKGEIKVEMGSEEQQLLSNIELMVLVNTCLLFKEKGLI